MLSLSIVGSISPILLRRNYLILAIFLNSRRSPQFLLHINNIIKSIARNKHRDGGAVYKIS